MSQSFEAIEILIDEAYHTKKPWQGFSSSISQKFWFCGLVHLPFSADLPLLKNPPYHLSSTSSPGLNSSAVMKSSPQRFWPCRTVPLASWHRPIYTDRVKPRSSKSFAKSKSNQWQGATSNERARVLALPWSDLWWQSWRRIPKSAPSFQ